MLEQTAIIMYSHSSYSDAWPMFIGQADKYIPECKRYLFADRSPISLPSKWKLITYDDAQSYNARFASATKRLPGPTRMRAGLPVNRPKAMAAMP